MKLALIAGTRPEIIKLAPLAKALEKYGIPFEWVFLRQHRELLDIARETFRVSGIEIEVPSLSLSSRLGLALACFSETLSPFSHIVVQGDTLTTLAGALVGFLSEKPVIHIEAGIRSHNLFQPFPEEQIRVFVDRVSWLRFAPTYMNLRNLNEEGLEAGSFCSFGNTVSDALAMVQIPEIETPFRDYFLVALLRRENWPIIPRVYEMLSGKRDMNFIVVVHPNHREAASALRGPHIRVFEPLKYEYFLALLKGARAVITDSGGTQEEASLLGVPAFILRAAIDRPESIAIGQAKQVADYTKLFSVIEQSDLQAMARPEKVYGDGRVSERIALYLKKNLLEL